MGIPPALDNPRRILIAGDLVVDHHIYEGERLARTTSAGLGVRHKAEVGGAEGIRRLLDAIDRLVEKRAEDAAEEAGNKAAAEAKKAGKGPVEVEAAAVAARQAYARENPVIRCETISGVASPDLNVRYADHHAFAIWQPHDLDPKDSDKGKVWRTSNKMGWGHRDDVESLSGKPFKLEPVANREPRHVLVLDDAGYLFRNAAHATCWHLPPEQPVPTWILLKLSEPVARGELWNRLIANPADPASLAHRIICMVSANDLRRELVRVTPGISWENALEGLSGALSQPPLRHLGLCRHLVVVFGSDAALWLDRENKTTAHFCFAPDEVEGDCADRFDGDAVGNMTAMAAALAHGIAVEGLTGKHGLMPWIEAGLRAMRHLLQYGHGPVSADPEKQPDGYPVADLAKAVLASDDGGLARLDIGWPREPEATPWMIVESTQRPLTSSAPRSLIGLAGAVLRWGHGAYGTLPHVRFGNFVTAERSEVEMLRGIAGKMRVYKKTNEKKTDAKPLAIGIFGPPGAGKSFAVREIAEAIFGKEAWLEFNLSQFEDNLDLNGALQQVRDAVLKGLTPVVFWDEFDSRNFHWLRYLLAPLQDGKFQDGPVTHGVGRSVFVFAGGTSWRFKDFGHVRDPKDKREQQLLKVPDFKSRLDAYYDVSGPNRRLEVDEYGDPGEPPCFDNTDVGFTLRRALLIRGQLGLKPDDVLDVDAGLSRALLLAPPYEHGARSLEKLMKSMSWRKGNPLRRSDLPHQLGMYVDAVTFDELMNSDRIFFENSLPEKLAPLFHAAYLKDASDNKRTVRPHLNHPFEELDVSWREDNIEAAARLPAVLALAGLGVADIAKVPVMSRRDEATIQAHLAHNVHRLARAEHDGWWKFRASNGWRYGTDRDDGNKIHPMMRPYSKLSESEKQIDCDSILGYQAKLGAVGYRIIWLDDAVQPPPNNPGEPSTA